MKRKRSYLSLIFLVMAFFGSAQTDTINQFNEKGQKTGYWKIYLNSNRCPTDSARATYIAYKIYDNGKLIFSYLKSGLIKKAKVVYSGNKSEMGKPLILNGTLSYYNSKNRLVLIEHFKNGYPVYAKYYKYNRRSDSMIINEFFDFSRRYNNQIGSYYFELTFTPTNIVSYWYRKGERKWKDHRITK